MSILASLIQQFFGSKSEKDIKEIQPIVSKIPEEYEKLKYLSNDQLRALSNDLKIKVRSTIIDETKQIEDLKRPAHRKGRQ